MKNLLRSIWDIRRGEAGITLLMLANIYLIMVTYYFLKPARDSLFLTKLGAEQLPLVFILIAFVIVPITTIYSRASRSLKLNQLFNATIIIIIVCLLGLRWMMSLSGGWVPYVFYTWVSVYGVLTTSQFWLLANAVYDAAQAKRLFVLLGLGAILGAWTGGEVTSLIVSTFNVSTENLLIFCIGFLLLVIGLTNAIWQLKKKELTEMASTSKRTAERKDSFGQMFGMIKRSRHLLLIVGIITLTMMVASLVDFQFKAVSTISFTDVETGAVDKSALTAFLGKFYGRLSLVSFLLQLIFAYRFLRILGVGGVILFLPLGLLVGSAALFFNVGLVAAVLLRGADGSLKYSIDKTGRELLFLPVPLEVKKRTKVFIDMFVDRWARGVSGGLILLLMAVFAYDAEPTAAIKKISLVTVGFLAVWIVMALKMRREYVNTFRKAIEKREIDLSEVRIRLDESATVNTLINSLASTNEREINYALEMLAGVQKKNLPEAVTPLLKHPSAEIRRKAIKVLVAQKESEPLPEVKKLLEDRDIEVRRDAMYYLQIRSDGDSTQLVKMFLSHPKPELRYTVLAMVAEYGNTEQKHLVDEACIDGLINLRDAEGTVSRTQVARVLGALGNPGLNRHFKRLLNDSSPTVVSEAIRSIGRLKEREYVPWLLNAMRDRGYRKAARDALGQYGESILGTLKDYLGDASVDVVIRHNIPRILCKIPIQPSVDLLSESINRVDPSLKYLIVKALNKLRAEHPGLKFDEARIDEALLEETRQYYEVVQVLKYQRGRKDDGTKLLVKALEERLDSNLERIFRILGLTYPPNDIYSAYQSIVSDKRTQRASAIEFLDNLLKSNIKRYLFPIIDETSVERTLQRGQELFDLKITNRIGALSHLIEGRDIWLKACAVHCCVGEDSPDLLKLIGAARDDRDPVVRETAGFVLNNKFA